AGAAPVPPVPTDRPGAAGHQLPRPVQRQDGPRLLIVELHEHARPRARLRLPAPRLPQHDPTVVVLFDVALATAGARRPVTGPVHVPEREVVAGPRPDQEPLRDGPARVAGPQVRSVLVVLEHGGRPDVAAGD